MEAPRSSSSDFIVLQALGKGSYGCVNKVKRKQDGQFYAVKEVNIKKLQPREREDAVNEIRIMASIKHRNIVRYCDAFVERDSLFIVMEFAEHGDISRQIDKFKAANKYIKEDTVWSYLIQMCNGLITMHSRNVLHRDLKPKNIFLTGKNHVRLGDLGCAKLMKAGMARTQIGTPYYMSPEIWMNKPYDARSDVWALGCLAYELAMLAPPFLANDMAGLAAKVKTAPAPRISKHYSEELSSLVASMLSKDPKMRPDVKTILASPAVQSRMSLLPAPEDDPRWAGEEMRVHLISTIKVPAGFGLGGFGMGGRMGGNPVGGGLVLPKPDFPLSGPAAAAAVAAAAAAVRPQSSPGKIPGGGIVAVDAPKENSSAPPAVVVAPAPAFGIAGGAAKANAPAAPAAIGAIPPRRPLSAGISNVAAQPVAPGAKPTAVAAIAAAPRGVIQPAAVAGGLLPAYAPRAAVAAPAVPPVAQAGIAGRAQAAAAAAAIPRAPYAAGAPSMLNRPSAAALPVPELRRGVGAAAAYSAAAPTGGAAAGRLGLMAPHPSAAVGAAAAYPSGAAYLYGARGGAANAAHFVGARPLVAGRPYY